MTFNERMIVQFMDKYKLLYEFDSPGSWFTFLGWLSSNTAAGNFTEHDIKLAKKLLNK